MLSVLPTPPTLQPAPDAKAPGVQHVQQFDDLESALEPFARLVATSGRAVRLHCTVPTWNPPADSSLSLDDLHDLRTRSLYFVHNLLTALRSSGISASYQLAPACSCTVALRAFPSDRRAPAAPRALERLGAESEHAFMALVDGTPTLVIT